MWAEARGHTELFHIDIHLTLTQGKTEGKGVKVANRLAPISILSDVTPTLYAVLCDSCNSTAEHRAPFSSPCYQ